MKKIIVLIISVMFVSILSSQELKWNLTKDTEAVIMYNSEIYKNMHRRASRILTKETGNNAVDIDIEVNFQAKAFMKLFENHGEVIIENEEDIDADWVDLLQKAEF